MATYDDIARRYLEVLEGRTDSRGRPLENYSSGGRMYASGTVLYSYGSHFPLCEYYGADRRRARPLFLLNGDRFSNTTSRHQRYARDVADRGARRFNADVILLPFSALESARIVRSSIRPLEVRPDTWLELDESADTLEGVPRVYRSWTTDHRSYSLSDVPSHVAARGWTVLADGAYPYVYAGRPNVRTADGEYLWLETHTLEPDGDGVYRWTRKVHRLGDSLFTAETSETVQRRRDWTVSDVIAAALEYVSAEDYHRRQGMTYVGRDRPWTATRNGENPLPTTAGRMLESLELAPIVERETVRRRRRYVSSFDTNEPIPAYFLATLPAASRALSVDTAIMDLAPAAVHAAILRGRDVRRQGDIFYIATELGDGDVIAGARSYARLTQWTRNARARAGETGYLEPISPARWTRIRRMTRRLYLERMTSGEHMRRPGPSSSRGIRRRAARDRASYETSLAAYRAACRTAILRADMPALARARGRFEYLRNRGPLYVRAGERDAYRQTSIGDRGVARDRMTDSFMTAYRRHSGRPESTRDLIRAALSVHGTAHTATEVAKRPDGRTYVRGIVRHVPELAGEMRGRDHVNVRLTAGVWYLAVRNTVPRSRYTAGR